MLPNSFGSRKNIEIQEHGAMFCQESQLFSNGYIKIRKFDHLYLNASAEDLQLQQLLERKRNMMKNKSKS